MLADRPDGRRLTAEEQFQLDDLERRLLADDGPAPRPTRRSAGTVRTRGPAVAAVAAAACGLLVLAATTGGPAGAAATALALAGTAAVSRLRVFRRR